MVELEGKGRKSEFKLKDTEIGGDGLGKIGVGIAEGVGGVCCIKSEMPSGRDSDEREQQRHQCP